MRIRKVPTRRAHLARATLHRKLAKLHNRKPTFGPEKPEAANDN